MHNGKLPFHILLLSFFIFLSSSAYSSEVAIFNGKQFIRTTGAPNIYTEPFTAEPGEARLVIRNGTEEQTKGDNNRVTSGVITLNGNVLFNHDDFKHQTFILETPVTLSANNVLRIELESKPGTFISLDLIQMVDDPMVDLQASDLQIDTSFCRESIDIDMIVTNTGEADIPAGVKISFYNGDPLQEGSYIGTTSSTRALAPTEHENISFRWASPHTGEADIFALVDDDGSGTGTYEEVDEANNMVWLNTQLCQAPTGNSSLSGKVIDAVNGNLLSDVTVILHTDDNGASGQVIASTRTNSEGLFQFPDLAAGAYIITAAPTGYIANQRTVSLAANVDMTNIDLVLSPVLAANEIRIVLTWNATPADLESHLTVPSPTGCRYHCYYWEKTIPTANLDLDDRDGYGPETITITDKVSGTYRYYVHDFTNRYYNTYWLARSGATVKVYTGNAAPMVFNVPNSYGNVWHVFDLDGDTGEIIPVHTMSNQSEPGRIDYPVITSSPSSSATWNTAYSYQVQASDPDDETLTYSLQQAPDGMTIDAQTGLIQWRPTGNQSGYYAVAVKVEDGRCGEVTQSFNIYVNSQPTAQFTVTPCSGYNPGGNITLTWSTTLATTVLIDQGIGEVSTSGTLTIPSPEAPTVYTLTAFNNAALIKRTVPSSPSASFYFTPYSILEGESSTLKWQPYCFANATIDHGIGQVTSSGSTVITPTVTTTYYLTVGNAAATTTYPATVYVQKPPPPPQPNASLTISPLCNFTPGDLLKLAWWTTNATEASIAPDVGPVELNGSLFVYPSAAGTYTLTAKGTGGSITRSASFPSAPTLSFSASPTTSIDLGDSVTLKWTAGCADTVTMNQGIGEVAATGSLLVTPDTLPKTYTLTAQNEAAPVSRSITLYQIPPSGTFTADPTLMKVGGTSTLTWTSTRATSCSISPEVGPVECNGAVAVTPSKPTTYTLTLTGPGGNYYRSVTVGFVMPIADLKASALTINEGESVQLTWVYANATGCVIDQGIGPVELGGEETVSPIKTTTYTMTATGPGGTATDKVTITVIPANPPPTVNISATNNIINRGDATTLNWQSTHADTLTITPDVGAVAASGSVSVSPQATTTYTATATGPGGTTTAKVTVTVVQPAPSMTLQAEPMTINPGESATLSWTSTNVDRIVFNQGIGVVALQGSLKVTPNVTTTYSATATGPGGTTYRSVTVTVSQPKPTVTFNAAPPSILLGETTTLSWTSTNANTVSISPGIGAVAASGSVSVSPTATTTYILTATGPGGTVTAQAPVTVTVPLPTVQLTATPATVTAGESIILGWNTKYAETCTLQPDIGTVPCTGQLNVAPQQNTTYTLTATGKGGTAISTATVTVSAASPISLTITSPIEGSTITRKDVMVSGTVIHSAGLETGVVVNGVRALVYGNQFVANHVPLKDGANTVTITAIDVNGKTLTKTLGCTATPTAWSIDLSSNTDSGLAPLSADLTANPDFLSSAKPTISYIGPGEVQFASGAESGTWTISITEPGIYSFITELKDDYGKTYSDKVAILAYDRTELDAALQGKWSSMKEALAGGDIEAAIKTFDLVQQKTFREIFSLTQIQLPQVVANMQAIELIYQKNDRAEYRIKKDMVFKGTPETVTFYIYFQKGADGIWRIWDF